MTLQERTTIARQLHHTGHNCCQSVVLAYADLLPIQPTIAANLAAPFGRGLSGCREVCGCVSAIAIVCGLTGHTDETRNLIEQFRQQQGHIVCAQLLQQRTKTCTDLVADATAQLHNLLEKTEN